MIGLELEPEDEARRIQVFESWDVEERAKRARGVTVAELVERFTEYDQAVSRRREQKRLSQARRRARLKSEAG